MERFKKTAALAAKKSSEVSASRFGIGFEKLDRGAFDPSKAYDKLGELGIKWVRVQSGWQRTESEKGVYDFTWLDEIVDNLIARGLKPWMCLCYGNGLYDEAAAKIYGAVGCPPVHNDEQKNAWDVYVRKVTEHYMGRIDTYEVWNEPDHKCWKHGVNAKELGIFTRDTAKAVHSVNPDACVVGGVVCKPDLAFLDEALATGMGAEIDAISFHDYTADETRIWEHVRALRALGRHYNPDMKIIQGETGAPSRSDGNGSLYCGAWTPEKQAKFLLRHGITDILAGCEFSSYFSCMDMVEALDGTVGEKSSYMDYGFFGVLQAEFDENGFAVGNYTPKPSYYALQNLASLFSDEYSVTELPVLFTPKASPRLLFGSDVTEKEVQYGSFVRKNGSAAFVYWHSSPVLTSSFESTVTIQFALPCDNVKLVDLYDGSVYDIPSDMIEKETDNCFKLLHMPIKDYPMVLTFGDF